MQRFARNAHDHLAIRALLQGLGYEPQRDKLNEEIASAEMAAHEAKLEELDIEAVINFSQHVLLNAARLWTTFSLNQKQRLQKVIFPEGLVYFPEGFGTAVTSPIFSILQGESTLKRNLAPQVGLEPTTLRLTDAWHVVCRFFSRFQSFNKSLLFAVFSGGH